MTIKYILEPNMTTEYKVHEGSNITFYIQEGKCMFETIYKNDRITVQKSTNEYYNIDDMVTYRLQNVSDHTCIVNVLPNN